MTQSNVRAAFERHFNTHGTLYASAGRINLIGEHTDYNGGFVFPGAVDCGITAMIRPNGTDRVRAYAVDLDSYAEFGLREEDKPAESWARYIFGVCREIQKRGGRIGGFDTAFSGDVPLGAGMSSSAALESTFAFALNDLYALGIDKFELARIGQSTEHNYCGVKCGIMDQFASVFGKKGCLMRLDCRSMEFEYFPFDPVGYKLVLLDTVVKHELVGSPYNRRRESCERVAKMLGQEFLRGATMERLDNKLPYVVCTGNHDYGYTKSENRLSRFPDYFPMTRNECWRHKIVSVCNNAHGIPTLENAAYEFHTDTWGDLLVVSLEFAPRDEAIEWARKLVAEPRYANTRVILLTHSFIAWKGNRKKTEPYELTDANYQQAIWDKLVYPSSNIRLVICGHECHPTTDYFETVGFRTDKNAAGKSVAQMMFNAQTADGQWHGNGGDCWLRILEFLPDGRTVSVRTFSPMFALSPVTCDKAWRTADYDQFTFDME